MDAHDPPAEQRTILNPRKIKAAAAFAAVTTAAAVAVAGVAQAATTTQFRATPIDLETATVAQLDTLLDNGTFTSVQLTQDYLNRIQALSFSGP